MAGRAIPDAGEVDAGPVQRPRIRRIASPPMSPPQGPQVRWKRQLLS